MPNLLVAPAPPATAATTTQEKDTYAPYEGKGDGWYSDGAYVAAPLTGVTEEWCEDEELDPQEAYYTALLERFEDLRKSLWASPPSSSAQELEAAVRPLLSNPKSRHWKHALLKSRPTTILLCSLPQEYVVAGIEVLEPLLTIRNLRGGVRHKLGWWAWGLLGRCRDVSEMDSEDVSVLRGLGKKACALLRRLRAGETMDEADEEEEEEKEHEEDDVDRTKDKGSEIAGAEMDVEVAATADEDDTGISHDADAPLEEARSRLLSGLLAGDNAATGDPQNGAVEEGAEMDAVSEQVSDAHAMLDMIVTIVGECYGQRDLLDGRLAWEEL